MQTLVAVCPVLEAAPVTLTGMTSTSVTVLQTGLGPTVNMVCIHCLLQLKLC